MMPFSDEDIYIAVKNHLPSVSDYVKSHGGGVKLFGVKEGKVYIQLTGTCHGCSMSLMTTKMVVEKRLRELIHPNLEVMNVEFGQEGSLPEDLVAEIDGDESEEKKESLGQKIKKYFN
jgi:Fe-S cluster biogenesis protein NfuA